MSGWGVKKTSTSRHDGEAQTVRLVNTQRDLPNSMAVAARRAKRMPNRELLDYADTSLSEIGRLLVTYGHEHGTGDALRDAEVAAGALYAVLAELAARQPVPEAVAPSVEVLRRLGNQVGG